MNNPLPQVPNHLKAVKEKLSLPSDKTKKILVASLLIAIPILSIAAVLYFTQKDKIFPKKPTDQTQGSNLLEQKKSDTVIATVGAEKIYQADLQAEFKYSPNKPSVNLAKKLLDKIIDDSIILQGAQADNLVKLDETVFNSPKKNYLKRTKLVTETKKKLDSKEDGITGTIVSIWFYNGKPGSAGYDKGKEIALQKITKLHDDVKNKKINMEQAGELIKKDTSLESVDKQYKSNAIFKFKANKGERIFFDPEVDKVLWQFKVGQISRVFLSKDKDLKTGKMIPSVYSFGRVNGVVKNGSVVTFEGWLADKRKQYEIKYN